MTSARGGLSWVNRNAVGSEQLSKTILYQDPIAFRYENCRLPPDRRQNVGILQIRENEYNINVPSLPRKIFSMIITNRTNVSKCPSHPHIVRSQLSPDNSSSFHGMAPFVDWLRVIYTSTHREIKHGRILPCLRMLVQAGKCMMTRGSKK